MSHHIDRIRRLLEDIATGSALSQRVLSRRLGIALGLTNQLLQLLSERGLVTTARGAGNRVGYSLTQAGSKECARLSREHLNRELASYSAARDRIRRCLTEIAEQADRDTPRVVFYGLGEAAEIGMACAAEAGVRLVGVVDDSPERERALQGVPVWSPLELTAMSLGGEPFDWILITSLSRTDDIRRQLEDLGLARERVFWL